MFRESAIVLRNNYGFLRINYSDNDDWPFYLVVFFDYIRAKGSTISWQ